ncbi:MAG TPA: NnrS family protein [Burkholderiales bacterium]|nr:NnrS family protein [Burkholderiales bacterium]
MQILSAGFRPFFFLAGLWAAAAVPVWLTAYVHGYSLRGPLPAVVWHAHELVFGFGAATVAGFLLTAIPNWTGRLPLRGAPLALLAALWLAGRVAILAAGIIGAPAAAAADLSFLALLIALVARELIAGRNWRNLPMLVALSLLLAGNVLVHLHALDIAYTAGMGNRVGIATLLLLIALVGGRIVPSFTRNWLARERRGLRAPAQWGALDRFALIAVFMGLAAWVVAPDSAPAPWLEVAAGVALAARLSRWRGLATLREPLLFVLHAGYGWLALGLVLLGLNGLYQAVPASAALHALTVGAIGTMTLAVMTRATLGHTGRPLRADGATRALYGLITLAALLRLCAPLAGDRAVLLAELAGLAWTAAFATFALHYGRFLLSNARSNP